MIRLRSRLRLLAILPAISACAGRTGSPGGAPAPQAPFWADLAPGTVHTLRPTPTTVVYGGYDPTATPALRVRSGDVVDIGTVSTCGTRLLQPGKDSGQFEPAIRAIQAAAQAGTLKRGPGGHVLTGPIHVDGAEPGDVLEVRFQRIALDAPYACNSFSSRSGFIPEDFPNTTRSKIIPLDGVRRMGVFNDSLGIEIPLRPFFGSVGVAPPPTAGRINSAPPGIHAGNLDNKELTEGTILYIPVHVAGALLQVGDGHAAQGDGEVDITALETSLRGELQLIVRKGARLTWPRGETRTHWIAMGADSNLTIATKIAVREAIALLGDVYHLSREEAYQLVSTGCDVRITQLVDGTMGAHVMIPKALFTKGTAPRPAPPADAPSDQPGPVSTGVSLRLPHSVQLPS